MKNFVALVLMASCLVASSQSFVLKESSANPSTAIVETKSGFVGEAKNVIADLKESAALKKQAAINGIKAIVSAKLGVASSIKNAKIALIKGVVDAKLKKLAALGAVKDAFYANVIEPKKAKLSSAVAAVAAKVQGLWAYKEPLKEKAAAIVSGAVSKVQEKIVKKKEFLRSLKSPAATVTNNVLVLQQQPYKLHTYVSDEAPVVGKLFVQEVPARVVVEKAEAAPKVVQTVASTSSVTSQAYGTPAETYGPPADSYGPPDSA